MDDAFGRALFDYHDDRYDGGAVFQRGTGEIDEVSVPAYFSPPGEWSGHTREMVNRVDGRVIDIGCGAGRASLALIQDGHDVLAVDRSPLAVRTARERGVGSVAVMDLRSLGVSSSRTESVLIIGQQLSSVKSLTLLRDRLRTIRSVVTSNGRLVADFADPTHESVAHRRDDLEWIDDGVAAHEFTIQYGPYSDPPTSQLMLSPEPLNDALSRSGWETEELFYGTGCTYAAVIRPT